MPDCGCNKKSCSAPAVLEITNKENPVIFHKVLMPAAMGDDETNPPRNGQYRNVLLEYEANGHIWMFSSDGIPTFISNGRDQGTINYEELLNKPLINDVELIGNKTLEDLGITDLVDDEAEAREQADTELQNAIDAEATTRSHADILLQDAIDAEVAAREAAVSAEESARIAADNNIISRIPVVNDATLTIQKNGSTVATFTANDADNVTADISVPTKTSDITNDSGFITNTVDDLTNYYTKTESDTALTNEATTRANADTNLQEQIDAISSSSDVVDVVGTYAELQAYDTSKLHDNDIIKVLTDETHDDAISYYRWDDANDTFDYIGSQGPFYTKSETDATFVPQTRTVNNKALSSNITLTAADVGALPDSTVIPTVNNAILHIQKNGTTVQTFTANQATNAVANITVPTKTSDLTNDSDFPVDANYVHTDNNYTTADKNKLAGIAAGAEVNVQSDWNESDNSSDAYIKNKPSIPDSTSDLVNDSGFITNSVNNLTNYYKKSETYTKTEVNGLLPTKTSDLTNDGADGSSTYVEADELATVATTGSYNDLSNKPTIPAAQVNSDWNASSGVAQILNKPTLATVATSGSYNDLTNKPTIPAAQVNSDWNASSGVAQILNKPSLATVATSGSYNDLTDKPDISLVEMSYGESNAWAKFIAAYQAGKIVYCRASSNSNPATGTQGRKAFMAYVNNAENPTEVEFQYVRSVSTKTSSQPVDQVYVYKLTNASGGTWTVQTRDMGPKLANGTNTTVSYSNGTYTVNASQPTVPTKTSDLTNDGADGTSTYVEADDLATVATTGSYNDLADKPSIPSGQIQSDWTQTNTSEVDYIKNKPTLATVATSGSYNDLSNKPTVGNATLTIQKNGTSAGTFTANATSNKTINITVPTTAADVSALPASTKYGASIAVSINTTDYKVTTTLKDQDGNTLGTAQVIDLPLESVVVGGSYDSTNKKIVLTLQNGNTIDIPVADLVAGLQSEITSTNKLSSDLVDDTNHTHKFVTAAQITKLNGIAAGAEVNVQSDWNQTTTTADDYIKNKPSLATVATSGSYNDLSNKPTIPTVNNATLTIQKNGSNVQTFTANQSTNATANITVPTKTSELTNNSGYITSSSLSSYLPLAGGTMTGATYGYFPATASTMVGNEYNILLNGGDRYTLTQSGTGTLTAAQVKGLFDGALAPQYSSDGVNPNNPYVLLIEGLPDVHTQTGGVFGWTCRYWVPTHFKVEFYDTYNSRGWVTAVEKTNTPTKELFVDIYRTLNGGSFTKIRITIYDSNGEAGANGHRRWGISEIFFCHPEAITPYAYANVDKANTATKATQDASGNVITTTYAKKTEIPTVNNATLTIQKNGTNVQTFTANQSTNATANITVPTKTSELTNNSNFVADASYVHTDNNYTTTEKNKLAGIAAGAEVNVQANWTQTTTTADDYIKNKPTLATVATSGSYNDLSNKPTIPTVNNATLTIQKNGSTVKTFTANASSNVTANITVPTKTSDITNDSDFTTKATAQEFAAQNGSVVPNFDDMTPVTTIEWDVSDTVYRAIYQMENTGWNYSDMDVTVAYRITVTGTNIKSVTDVIDKWYQPSSWPLTSALHRTQSTSAATTGFRYLRAVYPTASYVNNNTYKLGQEIYMYNSTARHVKVEVFKTNPLVTWNATKPTTSIYQGNTTYQGTSQIDIYATRGWHLRTPVNFTASSASQASSVSDFERVAIGSSNLLAGEALTAGYFAYLADDGKVYKINNTTKNIAVEAAKIGWISSGVNSGVAISQTYWRNIARPNATQFGYFSHDTMALGDRVFLRCTRDANGYIHSDNYLSKTMSAGHTWMPVGFMMSATALYADTRHPIFYTLDSSGKLSHVNGKAVAGTTYTAGAHINISGTTIKAVDYVHSDTPVSTSSVTPIVTNSMISNGTITFSKTATGEFLKLTLTTTDPGAGSALAANTLLGVYE